MSQFVGTFILPARDPFGFSRRMPFLVGRKDRDGRLFRAKVEWEEVDPVTVNLEPPASFSISDEEAQELMDKLYALGLRPSQAAGSAGQLSAVHAHLEDMRTLVFNKTPTIQPRADRAL